MPHTAQAAVSAERARTYNERARRHGLRSSAWWGTADAIADRHRQANEYGRRHRVRHWRHPTATAIRNAVKDLGVATADEMVLAFLKAELASHRWPHLHQQVRVHGLRAVVESPDLTDATQNRIRAALLQCYRGYGANAALFAGFPTDVAWRRMEIDHTELSMFRYAKDKDVCAASGPGRRVIDAARNVADGKAPAAFSTNVDAVADRTRNGESFPELIAVDDGGGGFILVEGHTRAAAYVLAKPIYPIGVLIGSSPNMSEWAYF